MARCIQSTSDHRRETAMLREVVPLIHQVTQQECESGRWQDDIFDPTA
jgi:LysR family nitrogen assimilation transcriptional regulator